MKKAKDIKIAIISSSFTPAVVANLEKNCLAALQKNKIKKTQVTIVHVPGSWEIPLVAKKLAKKNIYSALIAFGAIHKGDTYHFELIANECARGCAEVSLQYEIPVIFEVLAVYNIKDAIERATRKLENKGVEAALTALAMIKLLASL